MGTKSSRDPVVIFSESAIDGACADAGATAERLATAHDACPCRSALLRPQASTRPRPSSLSTHVRICTWQKMVSCYIAHEQRTHDAHEQRSPDDVSLSLIHI